MENVDADRGGLSRRELIKRSAIAGGVIWTAPVILSATDRAGAQALGGSPCECDPGKYYAGKWNTPDSGASVDPCTSVPGNDQDCSAVTSWLPQVPAGNNGTNCASVSITSTTLGGFAVFQVTVPDGCKILGACAKYGLAGGGLVCAVAPSGDRTVYFYKDCHDVPAGQPCNCAGESGGGISHFEIVWCCC